MRSWGFMVCVLLVAFFTRASSDPAVPSESGIAEPEPVTDSRKVPTPGSERPMRNPFIPYATDPTSAWEYESLPQAERDVIEQHVSQDYSATNSAFAAGTRALGDLAGAEAAAMTLGADNLDTMGVH